MLSAADNKNLVRTNAGTPMGECFRRVNLLRAIVILLAATLSLTAQAQSVFRGENVLAFAGRAQAHATPAAVDAAVRDVFERLQISRDSRTRFGFVGSATLQKEKGDFRAVKLSATVLLASGNVKIGSAAGAVIVADGNVEVGEASGLLVFARGSIKVGRESEAGVYISRGSIDVSNGLGPIVYAVRGAKVDSKEPFTAYNTSADMAGVLAYHYTRPALFQGEPVRAPAQPSMRVSTGESMPFAGNRCRTAVADTIDLHSQLLPYARRKGDCPAIDSAAVLCVQEEAPGVRDAASKEHWTFQLCGRTLTLLVQSKKLPGKGPKPDEGAYDHSITVHAAARPSQAAGAPQPPAAVRPRGAAMKSDFAAEDALALAGGIQPAPTREQAVQAVQRVLGALQLAPELRSKYAYMGAANFQVVPQYFEATDVSEALVLVNGSANISFARNAVIVARGSVRIAHGAGLVVIADGSVDLSHEGSLPGAVHASGVYVARGPVRISHAVQPVIYALKGTDLSHSGRTTAINTEFLPGSSSRGETIKYTVAALFSGEPPRVPTGPPAAPVAPFTYAGARCANPMPDEVGFLLRLRDYVQREAKCTLIRSVEARCAQESTAANSFTSIERWSVDLCERKLNVIYQVSGYRPLPPNPGGEPRTMSVSSSLNLEQPPPPAK